jgi:hypothetical protein
MEKLPYILGFCWNQFVVIWPKQFELLTEPGNYDAIEFTNIKIYLSSLNPGVAENIQSVYNKICDKNDTKHIVNDNEIIYYCVCIIQACV